MDLYRVRSQMVGEARCGREAQVSTLHYLRLNPNGLSTSFRRRRHLSESLLMEVQRPGADLTQKLTEQTPEPIS